MEPAVYAYSQNINEEEEVEGTTQKYLKYFFPWVQLIYVNGPHITTFPHERRHLCRVVMFSRPSLLTLLSCLSVSPGLVLLHLEAAGTWPIQPRAQRPKRNEISSHPARALDPEPCFRLARIDRLWSCGGSRFAPCCRQFTPQDPCSLSALPTTTHGKNARCVG